MAALIRQFIFSQVTVPTTSMYPTIKTDDKITVTRVYKKENLKRGDIIVSKSDELKDTLIKRLIGLPGDNRADSWNARRWENPYIDSKDIEGKAHFVIYPFKILGKFVIGKDALNH